MLAPHETNTVVPEKQLEGPREDPYPQVTWSSLKMVATGRKYSSTSTTTPTQTCLQSSTDASKKGWGAHLGEHTARRTWSLPESRFHINYLELKAVFLAQKDARHFLEQNSTHSHRQHHNVCHSMENPDLVLQERGCSESPTHYSPAECDSGQTVQAWPDHRA